MIANIALDYTAWAPPVTEDAIKRDIDTYQSQFDRTPSKIILWVHQWEHIAKKYAKYIQQPAYVIVDAEVDVIGLRVTARPAESSDGGRLWGIPVEVRDPENHSA